MRSIEITFRADGKFDIEGIGFKGKECDQKMADYEKALGGVTDRKNKPEYSQTTINQGQKQTV